MQISEWLSITNQTQSDLARIIGRNKIRAHRIVNKGIKPNDEEMRLIFEATGGQVSANDFYKLPKTKQKQPSNINKS